MSTFTGLFGVDSPSPFITNPKQLPLILTDLLALKTNNTVPSLSATGGFFTSLALRGAAGAITVADTYATLCDLTGSGFLCNVVCPTHTTAHTTTIRVTVDGVPYTFTVASVTAAYRLLLGCFTNTASYNAADATGSDFTGPNSYKDRGFNAPTIGGVPVITSGSVTQPSIMTPEQVLSSQLPVLRFESGLKVEVKVSLLSATTIDKQCGVTYRLDL